MVPVLLDRDEIDIDLWNRCINDARFSCLYACSWYLDIVAYDWKGIVIENGNEYTHVMPVPIKNKLTFTIVYQPFYCQYLGIFSKSEITAEITDLFLQVFTRNFWYISAYNFHPALYPVLCKTDFSCYQLMKNTFKTHWIYFSTADSSLNYNHDRKFNLKKAQKYGWEVSSSKNLDFLIQLFDKYQSVNFKNGIHPNSFQWLRQLATGLFKHDAATLWYACKNGEVNAGILVAQFKNIHYYLFNSSDLKGRKGNARTWLLDNYFKLSCKTGMIFDFESPEHPQISAHYQSYGAKPMPFISVRKNGLPKWIKWLQEWRINRSQSLTSN